MQRYKAGTTNDDYLNAAGVRGLLGDISQMTLWRWTRTLGFPTPDMTINKRRFWKRSTVEKWTAAQEQRGQAA